MNDIFDLGGRVLLYTAWVPLSLFVFSYAIGSRWWATEVGRMMISLSASLWAVITLSLSRVFLGDDWAGIELVRLVVYTAMNVSLWSLFFTLRKIQKATDEHPLESRDKRDEKEGK